ncbi:hypothetical protein AALA80_17700 [Oscillospiraceae bacterium 50-60]
MKIRFEHNGTVFEFESRPMKEGRFRALCLLAAAGVYAGMVAAVAALCNVPGLVLLLVGTAVVTIIARGMD